MVAKTDAYEEDLEKLIFGKTNSLGITETNYIFLASALTGDPETAGNGGSPVFTEPATADGYARLSIASAFSASTADPDIGIANAIQAQMNTASAAWPEIRWGGVAKTGTRGVNDAILITVLSDGIKALFTVDHVTQTFKAPGHTFTIGMLISLLPAPGATAPGGVTTSITKQYVVAAADQSAGTFTIQNENNSAVTISSDGSGIAIRVVPIPAGAVAQNTAVTFGPNSISYAEG